MKSFNFLVLIIVHLTVVHSPSGGDAAMFPPSADRNGSVEARFPLLRLTNIRFPEPRESPRRRIFQATCDLPSLPNGKVMRRSKGKMLAYVCNSPYRLIGSKYANCKNRRWDSPVPICAKSGCPDISTAELKDHMVFYENNKIMATLRCRSEYVLRGASVAYCDGIEWDRPLGQCHPSAGMDNLSCDFESEDLCGWSHDENEDFRWARRSGQPYTLRQRTGPRADHTVGKLHEGHYMLMESFEQEAGDRALFFSPIYSAEKSQNACYRFFYHMYGIMVGTLRVYVKPVSVDMELIGVNPKYQYFEMKGNQKNIWREARFNFEETTESFQIVFEGVLRSSLFGDIAIDDVELLQGEECLPEGEIGVTQVVGGTTPPDVEMEDNFAVILSCTDRCGEQSRTNKTGGCDCHSECSDTYSCCPDYGKLCLTAAASDPPTTTTPQQNVPTKSTAATRPSSSGAAAATVTVVTKRGVPAKTTAKPTTSGSFYTQRVELVDSVTVYHIQPKALDDLGEAVEIVSVHRTVIFVSIVGCLCLTLIVTMLLVRHCQKRRFDSEFYKKGNENSNSCSAREEFSEIRYLTEDEHLDFSMATPSTFKPPPSAIPESAVDDDEEEQSVVVSDEEKSSKGSGGEEGGISEGKTKKKGKKDKDNNKTASSSAVGVKIKKNKSQKKFAKDDPDNEGLLQVEDDDDW